MSQIWFLLCGVTHVYSIKTTSHDTYDKENKSKLDEKLIFYISFKYKKFWNFDPL